MIEGVIDKINTNKYFVGFMMIILTIGGRFIISELTEEQRKQLLAYMWSRPYGEVAQLVAMLASLKNKKNDNVTPKK